MKYNYSHLLYDLNNLGLKSNDVLMIHSSFKSVKNIEGGANTILRGFKEILKDGLILIPTHTWATMKEDYQVMDKKSQNSCVGYLTNVVIADDDFVRSNHPTHSVAACGKNALEYIKDDDYAKTPASPNGCFGKLINGGKILFLGAPLSKNTFVHSLEEMADVPNRFTQHIYTFYTKDENGDLKEFHMPRHFNEKCPHISDNYEKLLPIMLEKNIAKEVKILDSKSYLVDAQLCSKLVFDILKKDIHAFDDDRDIKSILYSIE